MKLTLNAFELMSHLELDKTEDISCKAMRVGIGITTTTNRQVTAKRCLDKVIEYSKGCQIYIVSDTKGISKAKNQCLANLEGCDWVVLLDDDIFPLVKDWYLPYINSGENHLCFTFSHFANGARNGNRELQGKINGLNYYKNPNGCALFISRLCIDKIGGFDETFIGWSYEHVNYSQRIHNVGLTTKPFMDLPNSKDLLYSLDYFQEIKGSVDPRLRMEYINHNRPIYEAKKGSKEWINYKSDTSVPSP